MLDTTAGVEVTNDARARANVLRLAAAQALTGANSAVIFATGSIVGATLAPSISLATVPLSMYVLGLAAGTLPTGAISRAYGRRTAFIIGTFCGVLTGALAAIAVLYAFVLAVLRRDISRRSLRRGSAVLSFCRGRRRQHSVPAESRVVGDGGRRIRRRARSAARAVDHGYLAAVSVCLQLRGAGLCRAGGDGGAVGRRCAEARAVGHAWRPAAVRDRAAAALHRGGAVRGDCLSHDESRDDLGAARHEDVRADRQRFQFRHSVAHRGDVRAELLHGLADRALRRAKDRGARPAAGSRSGRHRPFRHHRAAFLGDVDRARGGVELCIYRRVGAGAGDASAAGTQQGAGLQRFPGVRDDGAGLVLFRPVAGALRLVDGKHGGVSAGAARPCGFVVASFAKRRAKLRAVDEIPDPSI